MIFLVNFTYENNLTYTYYINLVAAIIRQQKFLLTWRELLTLALSCKVSFKCCCQVHSWLLIKNFEHSCDQVLSEWYFQEKNTITTTEVVFISNCSLITLFLNKKIKMKTQNIMACLYHSTVTYTQNKGVRFSSCLIPWV